MVFEVEAQPEGVHLVDSEVNDNEPSPEPDPKGPSRPPKGRPSLKVVK